MAAGQCMNLWVWWADVQMCYIVYWLVWIPIFCSFGELTLVLSKGVKRGLLLQQLIYLKAHNMSSIMTFSLSISAVSKIVKASSLVPITIIRSDFLLFLKKFYCYHMMGWLDNFIHEQVYLLKYPVRVYCYTAQNHLFCPILNTI